MKFGKRLQVQVENTLPEWRPNFLCYKQLKKCLKRGETAFPMTLWTAAILNPSLEDGYLISVNAESAEGDRERVVKRERDDATTDVDDRVAKRTVPIAHSNGTLCDSQPREQTPPVVEVETVAAGTVEDQSERDANFLRLVKTELQKFNIFFLEKEEEFLIRLGVLEEKKDLLLEKLASAGGDCSHSSYEDLIQVNKQFVDLHGEMVLLINYSFLNYIGLLKILKKYDKRLGANLRQTVHGTVLHQPFYSVTNVEALVARCLECESSLRSSLPSPAVIEAEAPSVVTS